MKNPLSLLLISILFCISFSSNAQLIRDKDRISRLEKALERQKELAKKRDTKVFGMLSIVSDYSEKQGLSFLLAYAPLSDLADYDGGYFLENVRTTLKAKHDMPWCDSIPEDVFLHFVLPVRINNENLDSFRIKTYSELAARVKGLNMREAALEVNHWCHEKVTYKGSDSRTSAPLSTMRTSYGRCGEESTFTVSALRTVGIPARQVYTPRWAHSDDNHAWVEVWINGKWYFMGACEPEPDLNMGWFEGPAKRAMLVHTRAYGFYQGTEEIMTKEERFSELNLIANYAPVKKLTIKVLNNDGNIVPNAKVEYRLYNYAEFYPLTKNFTDAHGITEITLGLGDILIWANKDNNYGYQKVTVESSDTVKIKITDKHENNYSLDYDIVPPVTRNIDTTANTLRSINSARLLKEDSIRNSYMKTFKDSAWAVNFANQYNYNADSCSWFIINSCGNWPEITAFLIHIKPEFHSLALKFLEFHAAKDLHDTKAEILLDHFNNSLQFYKGELRKNPDFFVQSVMSGRVDLEMMTNWRAYLMKVLDKEFKDKKVSGKQLISWTRKTVILNDKANLHSRAPLTPKGAESLGVSDSKSRDILFVAACRSMGIASRLEPAKSLPQYWDGKSWQDVYFDKKEIVKKMNAAIHLVNGTEGEDPKYETNFTLSRFKEGTFQKLEYGEDIALSGFPEKLDADTGNYLLVTGNRLDDGSVLASLSFFRVDSGKTVIVPVKIRKNHQQLKSLGLFKFDKIEFQDLGYPMLSSIVRLNLAKELGETGMIMIWMDPDKEPTKHVMADIPAVRSNLEKWGGRLVFIVPENNYAFKPDNYKGLPAQSVFVNDAGKNGFMMLQNVMDRKLGNNYPYIVLIDKKNQVVFFSEGYKIGIGEQMSKTIRALK